MNATSVAIGNDPLDPHRLTLNNGIQQGDFYVGPVIPPVNATPVQSITEYLAKRDDNSGSFVTLKILQVRKERDLEVSQGKLLLHNEHLVLSLLQDQPGVVHHQGFFKDRNRFILILDCLVAHYYDKDGYYKDLVNLQHYVIKKKRLDEREALELFYSVLLTVQSLHKKNIVHRDLKLGNLVLNSRTRAVTLTSFALSKHLVRSNDKLTDQRGSLAYVSPDVLSGRPYDGKASDMWALGVLLYTMLYGQFPFYDNDPQELFKKIKAADYVIPDDGYVKMQETTLLIRQLIEKDFKQRLTAAQTLDIVQNRLSRLSTRQITEHAQVVPDSVVRSKSDDCTVPDQTDNISPTHSVNSHTLPPLTPSNIDLNAVRLTLSPMLITDLDSHSSHRATFHMPVSLGSMNTSPVHMTPGSPTAVAGPFVPYVLTDYPPSHVQRPLPSLSSQNPFLNQASSSAPLLVNTSPSSSLNMQHTNSLGSLPEALSTNIPTSPHSSPSSTFPPPSFFCHRYPVALSLSGDSYFSTSPQNEARTHSSERPDTNTQSRVLFSQEDPSSSVAATRNAESRVINNQSVMDSLVTIRPTRHSFSSGVNVDSMRSSLNQHNFSNERLSPQHFIPASTHSQTQRRRRNSSGTERVRRHSHQNFPGNPTGSLDSTRRRRRSHDIRDERTELLEGLRVASTRRASRTQSNPFSVPIRIQLSSPTVSTAVAVTTTVGGIS